MNAADRMEAFARKALGLAPAAAISLAPFPHRGSDRSYFRLRWDAARSAILMHYYAKRPENACSADISRFLESIGVPTARVLEHDPVHRFILLEDLGDTDLWALRRAGWETRRDLYRKALAAAGRLHAFPENLFPANRVRLCEPFGTALYRWEHDYFLEHCVGRLCGIDPGGAQGAGLRQELEALSERLAALPRCLVHRDLQSQNIMVRDGNPFLIDCQGMRFGTFFYDLGSLLYDPYVDCTEGQREELLRFYYGLSVAGMDWDAFLGAFLEASAQRLMQALGAYGFLGITRGMATYLAHVRPGLSNLHRAASGAGTLPELRRLASRCIAVIAPGGRPPRI